MLFIISIWQFKPYLGLEMREWEHPRLGKPLPISQAFTHTQPHGAA